jgi:hypothetical protein
MQKDKLLQTAKELQQPSAEATKEFSQKARALTEKMNTYMMNRPDVKQLVGDDNIEMMKDNHANHTRFMASLFDDFSPDVFVDTVMWVFRAYRARDFSSTYWAAQLNGWMNIYKKELSENTYREIFPFYNWMQVNIPVFNKMAEGEIDAPLSSH